MRILCFLGFFLASTVSFAGEELPFFAADVSSANKAGAGVLWQHAGRALYKKAGADQAAFDHLYWVNHHGRSYASEDLSKFGKVVYQEQGRFSVMEILATADIEKISHELHVAGMSCGAIVKLNGDVIAPMLAPVEPVIGIDVKLTKVQNAIAQVDQAQIRNTVDTLAAMPTRYYKSSTGIMVAEKLSEMYMQYAEGRSDVEISTFDHSSLPQPSLMVRIVGQTMPDEIIVLGSHIDSINGNGSNSARAPGADDNASGTATNLEIFRVLMQQGVQLDRTLEIHGYAAEEIGLKGSQDIAAIYKQSNKNVVAMVQHDMNLYSADGSDKIWFVSNSTSEVLNNKLIGLLTQYSPNVAYGMKPLYFGTSDHASWTRQGYHASFPFEDPDAYNRSIHTASDTSANASSFSQAAEFVRLGIAYVAHFGGMINPK